MNIYGDEKTKGPRAQFQKLSGLSAQEKFDYIVHYYGKTILLVLFIIAIIISVTVTLIKNNRQKVISGDIYTEYFQNDDVVPLHEALCEKLDFRPEDYPIDIFSAALDDDPENAMYQAQQIQARIIGGGTDFIGAKIKDLQGYMDKDDLQNCSFFDLRELLSPELLSKLESENRLIYLKTSFAGDLPYLISAENSKVSSLLQITGKDCYIGFLASAGNIEGCKALAELLSEDP